MNLKWKMISYYKFESEYEDYKISVSKGGIAWLWSIIKNGVIVDECFYHNPTDSELAAKVQVERVMDKLIKSKVI